MLKEMKGLEYTLEILRALEKYPGEHDSSEVYSLVSRGGRLNTVSKSYIQKILPRMVKANLLLSSSDGYRMARSLDQVTVDTVLNICDLPDENSPIYKLCVELKEGVSLSGIKEFYDFG
jgi:DNA-binding IscR family transcriptional regulator